MIDDERGADGALRRPGHAAALLIICPLNRQRRRSTLELAPLRLLLINPNTSPAVTDTVAAVAGPMLPAGVEVVPVPGRFGARYIASRAAATIAGHAAVDALAEDDDVRALAVFIEAIDQAQSIDRHSVRKRAAEEFGSDRIVDSIITAVNMARLEGGIATATSV